jgi:hypothetical protein
MLRLEICNGFDDACEMVAVVLVATTWFVSSHCCCKSACTRCIVSGYYFRRARIDLGVPASRGCATYPTGFRLRAYIRRQMRCFWVLCVVYLVQVPQVGAYDVGGNIELRLANVLHSPQ